MPAKSEKQARTMRAAAHDPKFAKKMGIPRKVARELMDFSDGKVVQKKGGSVGKRGNSKRGGY